MTGSAVVSPFRSTAALLWTAGVPVRPVGYSSDMCSGAGSGAAGSAGGRGAVDAGCPDPMLDRLLAVEVAGLPDSALAVDLVGLRVAVSRLESEFARRLVVFDRRGRPGSPGRCPPRPGCAEPVGCPPGRPASGCARPGCWPMTCRSPPTPWPPGTSPTPTPGGAGRGGRGRGARPAPADGGRHVRRRGGARRSTWRSPTPTTSGTGSTAAPPTWPTWRWSAGGITG